jgi:hypothetical protein
MFCKPIGGIIPFPESWFQNENRNHSCAFFAAKPQKTGLSGGSAAYAAASRPSNPIAPHGLFAILEPAPENRIFFITA